MAKKDLPTLKDVSRIPEELRPVVTWFQDHGQRAGTVAVVVLAVCLGIYAWHNSRVSADAADTLRLAADTTIEGSDSDNALVLLRQAAQNYNDRSYDAALALYDELTDTLADDPDLKFVPQVGRLNALIALGRLDEAASAVQALEPELAGAAGARMHFLYPELCFAKAQLLCQKGDKLGAKAALAEILAAPKATEQPLAEDADDAARAAYTRALILRRYTPRAELLAGAIDAFDPANPEYRMPDAPAATNPLVPDAPAKPEAEAADTPPATAPEAPAAK